MPLPESGPKDRVSHGGAETVSPEPALCDQANDNIFKLNTLPRVRIEDRQDVSARDAVTPMMAKTTSISSRVKVLERGGRMTTHSYHLAQERLNGARWRLIEGDHGPLSMPFC